MPPGLTDKTPVHVRVTLAAGVLGRTWRRDQRGVHRRARAQQQTLVAQQVVDQLQNLRPELVLLQQATKPQDRRLVGQATIPVQARKFTEQRDVVQRLLHGRVAQREPLLHEVNAQHRLHSKGRATSLAFGPKRRDQLDQCRPRHHSAHLVQKLALARSFRRQVQTQVGLLHVSKLLIPSAHYQAHRRRLCAEFP